MNLITTRAAEMARWRYGITLQVEELGGGCTVLAGTLDGGGTIVLSDGNQGHDLGDFDYFASASLYAPGAWQDEEQPEPIRHAASQEIFAAADVMLLISEVLG